MTNETPSSSEGELTHFRNRNLQFRSEARYKSPLAALAYLRRAGAGERETIWLANLSYNGVALLTKASIPDGAPVLLEIPALASGRRELPAVVMHATQQLNGDWLVGCQLDVPLTEEELETCLTFDSPYLSQVHP